VPGPAPWMAADRLEEQRRRLPASSFARLFENRWTAAEDRLASLDDLAACVTLEGPLAPQRGLRYAIGLDRGLTHDRTAAAVCHSEPLVRIRPPGPGRLLTADGSGTTTVGTLVILDRMEVRSGSPGQAVQLDEVEAWVAQAAASYRAQVVTDPWQAVGICPAPA
jgi:hypothetical protein